MTFNDTIKCANHTANETLGALGGATGDWWSGIAFFGMGLTALIVSFCFCSKFCCPGIPMGMRRVDIQDQEDVAMDDGAPALEVDVVGDALDALKETGIEMEEVDLEEVNYAVA